MASAFIAARIVVEAKRVGRPLETGDAWIAATAVHHSLVLYTHDGDILDRDFPGLTVVSFLET